MKKGVYILIGVVLALLFAIGLVLTQGCVMQPSEQNPLGLADPNMNQPIIDGVISVIAPDMNRIDPCQVKAWIEFGKQMGTTVTVVGSATGNAVAVVVGGILTGLSTIIGFAFGNKKKQQQ